MEEKRWLEYGSTKIFKSIVRSVNFMSKKGKNLYLYVPPYFFIKIKKKCSIRQASGEIVLFKI